MVMSLLLGQQEVPPEVATGIAAAIFGIMLGV